MRIQALGYHINDGTLVAVCDDGEIVVWRPNKPRYARQIAAQLIRRPMGRDIERLLSEAVLEPVNV